MGDYLRLSAARTLTTTVEEDPNRRRGQQLRQNMEGFTLLRRRLREANGGNREFEKQYSRLQEVLQIVLLRLSNGFSDQVDQVVAIGEWTDEGIDLRNLPFDDIILGIVSRSARLSYDLHRRLAQDVFTDLRDDDIVIQFHLETQAERRRPASLVNVTNQQERTSIVLLDRA